MRAFIVAFANRIARFGNSIDAGAYVPPTPPSYTPSLDFSDARNSMYAAIVTGT